MSGSAPTRRSVLGLIGLSAAGAAVARTDVAQAIDHITAPAHASRDELAGGETTSVDLTSYYLRRIRSMNPTLHALIETNPDALTIARARDAERRRGHVRGPLHGLPVVVKDNIATADAMQTTAGSFALLGSKVRADAAVVHRLRAAGAVILGKTNLSEWANFRGGYDGDQVPIDGWSARGGFTRNPYRLEAGPCGSSSGSAVAVAADLCGLAVGTETDGSILCPSGVNGIVGLKPTIGLVPQNGIIPISTSQDCAGPMGWTVRDVAMLLAVLQDPAPAAGLRPPTRRVPSNYSRFLDPRALRGARLGVDPQYLAVPDGKARPDVQDALDALRSAGAVIVGNVDLGAPDRYLDAETTILRYEFKVAIARYLSTLRHTRMRSLADLIAFNKHDCGRELRWFDQAEFEAAEATSGNLDDKIYRDAVRRARRATRTDGLDRAFRKHRLDAVIGSTAAFLGSPAAVAGYPSISVPAGVDTAGLPFGLTMLARPYHEGPLLGLAHAFERETRARRRPQLLGAVPGEPKHYAGCT